MIIKTPRQLLGATAALIGYQPDNSLVLVAMSEEEVLSIVRLDWPNETIPLPQEIARATKNAPKPSLVLVAYTESALTLDRLIELVPSAKDYQLLDALWVRQGHWGSLMCDDETCCPMGGHALSDLVSADLAPGSIASAWFRSREDLSAKLESIDLSQDEMYARDNARGALGEQFARSLTASKESPSKIRSDLLDELMCQLDFVKPWDWQQHALLALVVGDIRMRDGFLRQMLDHPSMRLTIRSVLIAQTSRAQEADVAALATALAGCAWLDSDGELASLALERALASDPSYSLARLLDRALIHAVPSSVWSESLEAVSYDECLAGAA
jgi:hypothetical protein